MADNDAEILQDLKRVTAGLLFMSESDYPFEVIHWESPTDVTHDFLCRLAGEPTDCQVEEMEVEDFLSAEKYRNIVRVLSNNLTERKAYKIGKINMPVYVLGRSKQGNWLGVSTRVVQT